MRAASTTPFRHAARRLSRLALAMLLLTAGALGFALGPHAQDSEEQEQDARGVGGPIALVLELGDAVTPASADYLTRAIAGAAAQGARLIVIRMDTPGGLVASMRQIVQAIIASPVPVATYVAPSGARAASAGTFILLASHIAAMAPSTSVGAATPVAMGGGLPFGAPEKERGKEDGDGKDEGGNARVPADASMAKAINDAVAQIRGLAELHGRNAEWAEQAVREAATLTASAAVARNVADFTAASLEELLATAHGRVVAVAGAPVTLDTKGLAARTLAPDWRTQLLSVITNPNVALLFMVIGFYGILFELLNPGALIPGTVGAISLLIGLYALSVLPVSYAGLGLMLLGLALLVAEIFTPSFGILGIGGTVAMVFGAMLLFDTEVPGIEVSWPVLAAVTVASAAFSLLAVRMAMVAHRGRVTTGVEDMIGAQADVLDWRAGRGQASGRGHVFVRGERWKAQGPRHLRAGQPVRVAAVKDLTLHIEPVPDDAPDAASGDASGQGGA